MVSLNINYSLKGLSPNSHREGEDFNTGTGEVQSITEAIINHIYAIFMVELC